MSEIITYKGFDKNLQCRGFQYAVGQTFTHDGQVQACNGGFHACEYPLDIFSYYPPAGSRFAVVEQSGDLSRKDNGDSKVASRQITIKAEIDIPFLVKAAIEYTTSRCKPIDKRTKAHTTADQGAASATGYQGAASATGEYGAASATGENSIACGLGWQSTAMAGETGAIVLVYRDVSDTIIHIRASKVGENGIKAGTWYKLDESGNFIEA